LHQVCPYAPSRITPVYEMPLMTPRLLPRR
jgi:hypothetical protein